MIVHLPDGRRFADCPYRRIDEIPRHFHVWEGAIELRVGGYDVLQRCRKCGLIQEADKEKEEQ